MADAEAADVEAVDVELSQMGRSGRPRPDVAELPAGVPEVDDVAVSLAEARLAAQEIANRRSDEEAYAASEASRDAERELAWRRRGQALCGFS